jgi:3-oxoacyl-(acyl-carrier-protein) synthase
MGVFILNLKTNKTMNIYVTGMGVISAIGNNTQQTLRSLQNSETGLRKITQFKTRFQEGHVAGEIPHSNEELAFIADIHQTEKPLPTRTTILGMIAVREAMRQSDLKPQNLNDCRTGFISSSTVGGMVYTEKHFQKYLDGDNDINFVDTNDMGDSTEYIADYLGVKDFVTTINTACASGANAIILGARMIRSGMLDRVIVGGSDALCQFTLNGFNSLMLIDPEPCKPFDENRKGINLGEGAGYMVIESEEIVNRTNKKTIAKVSGYGCTNDAYHQTSSSPDGYGIQLAMNQSLKLAGLQVSDIGYLNAHGTGTPNNDLAEGMAIKILMQDKVPFGSTKSFTGHTLAPSGAIEAIFSVLSLKSGIIPVNLNFEKPIEAHQLKPVTKVLYKTLGHVMSNSIGIGGSCASIIFSQQ